MGLRIVHLVIIASAVALFLGLAWWNLSPQLGPEESGSAALGAGSALLGAATAIYGWRFLRRSGDLT